MNQSDLLDQLAELPKTTYRTTFIASLVGPLLLRLFGLKGLSRWIRPLALLLLVAGMYAKQQKTTAARSR